MSKPQIIKMVAFFGLVAAGCMPGAFGTWLSAVCWFGAVVALVFPVKDEQVEPRPAPRKIPVQTVMPVPERRAIKDIPINKVISAPDKEWKHANTQIFLDLLRQMKLDVDAPLAYMDEGDIKVREALPEIARVAEAHKKESKTIAHIKELYFALYDFVGEACAPRENPDGDPKPPTRDQIIQAAVWLAMVEVGIIAKWEEVHAL